MQWIWFVWGGLTGEREPWGWGAGAQAAMGEHACLPDPLFTGRLLRLGAS